MGKQITKVVIRACRSVDWDIEDCAKDDAEFFGVYVRFGRARALTSIVNEKAYPRALRVAVLVAKAAEAVLVDEVEGTVISFEGAA